MAQKQQPVLSFFRLPPEPPEDKREDKRVRVAVVATEDGYYINRIIKAGEKFVYEGRLRKDGTLPLWMEMQEGAKPELLGPEKKEVAVVEQKTREKLFPSAEKKPDAPAAQVSAPVQQPAAPAAQASGPSDAGQVGAGGGVDSMI